MVVDRRRAGAPAAEAGLKRGDVIIAVDGQPVDDAEGVGFRLGVKPLGGVASLTVLRAGRNAESLPLKLAAAPEDAAARRDHASKAARRSRAPR